MLEEDLSNLSTAMFNMARSVMGGGTSIGEAFANMSHSLRSGRKEMVHTALDARDLADRVSDVLDPTWKGKGPFGAKLTDGFKKLLVKDIPAEVLEASPVLRDAITRYMEEGVGLPVWFKTIEDVVRLASGEEFLGIDFSAGIFAVAAKQINEGADELRVTADAAARRLGHDLGTRNQEMHRMLSMKDVINRASKEAVQNFEAYAAVLEHTEFEVPVTSSFATSPEMQMDPLLGGIDPGTVEAAAAAYEAAGKGGGEAYYTALAFSMEQEMKDLAPDLKKIMGPKYEAAMGWLASKGGQTFKDALKVAGGGITFGDLIVSSPETESALTHQIYNITQEMERQKLLMNDTTGIQKQEKELYLLDMTVKLRKKEIELAHRRGDQSKTLWAQDQEAMDASLERARHQIKVIGDLDLATAEYSEKIAFTKIAWKSVTPEETSAKHIELARLRLEADLLANEKALESGKRTFSMYHGMLFALGAAFHRLKKAADVSEEFRKTSEAMQEQIFLVEAGWDESTIESFTNKSLELAKLRHESDVAEYTNKAELAGKATEEINAHVAAMGSAYQREVDGMINGSYQLGSAWDELVRDSEKLQEKWEQIGVDATNMMVDGLTEGMLMMAKGADDANSSWKNFSRNFINTIAMMIMRLYMMKAVMAAMNMIGGPAAGGVDVNVVGETVTDLGFIGANGGVIPGGLGPMTAYANGGLVPGGLGRMVGYANGGPIVSGAHTALIGEGKYNEAIVPLPDGKSIPVQMAGGGGATNVNISINAVDAKGVDELLISRQSTLRRIIAQAMTESRWFRNKIQGHTGG